MRDADPVEPLRTVSLYTNGPFTDLCRGPHAPSTKTVGAFKLQSVAAHLARGLDEDDADPHLRDRVLLQGRLEEHLARLEQAKARDHRKLGRELDLFMFSELSPAAAFW